MWISVSIVRNLHRRCLYELYKGTKQSRRNVEVYKGSMDGFGARISIFKFDSFGDPTGDEFQLRRRWKEKTEAEIHSFFTQSTL